MERAIRTIRDQFWPARHWKALNDLNAQAEAWCNGWVMDRPCPEDRSIPVREDFAQENLLPLPDTPYPTDERVEVRIGKTPYARFDRNDYSVPHTQVQRILTVVASPTTARILGGPAASAPRSGIVPLESVACSASCACLSGFGVRAAHSRQQLNPSSVPGVAVIL